MQAARKPIYTHTYGVQLLHIVRHTVVHTGTPYQYSIAPYDYSLLFGTVRCTVRSTVHIVLYSTYSTVQYGVLLLCRPHSGLIRDRFWCLACLCLVPCPSTAHSTPQLCPQLDSQGAISRILSHDLSTISLVPYITDAKGTSRTPGIPSA